jgi:HSP20 family protein
MMALVRFRPFGSLDREGTDIQLEVNRLFDSFFGRGAPTPAGERVWAPPVDVYETQDEMVVNAELPGLSEKDIHLSITGDLLTLRGERRWEEQGKPQEYLRTERWYGKFERTLPLAFPVQAEQVKASYRDGVLVVTLPKAVAMITMRVYNLKHPVFHRVWIDQDEANAKPEDGSKLRIILGQTYDPQVEITDDFVRVSVRRVASSDEPAEPKRREKQREKPHNESDEPAPVPENE